MISIKYTFLVAASFLFSGMGSALGSIALAFPLSWFIEGAGLVAIVEVKTVTEIEVKTGDHQTSKVYVAEAEVLQALKSDLSPSPSSRRIAIVGSTIPDSSAVWKPIEKKRYLAFLNCAQGHYGYGEKFALRPINAEGKVEWLKKKAEGGFDLIELDIKEAIKRIELVLDRQGDGRITDTDIIEPFEGIDGID
jgi:hypothetical protein